MKTRILALLFIIHTSATFAQCPPVIKSTPPTAYPASLPAGSCIIPDKTKLETMQLIPPYDGRLGYDPATGITNLSLINKKITTDPIDSRSAAIIAFLATFKGSDLLSPPRLHPGFGAPYLGAPNGIPYTLVCSKQVGIPANLQVADESDLGNYLIPTNNPIESGDDKHTIAVDIDNNISYEFYLAQKPSSPNANRWFASSGAIFNLNSADARARNKTSADAAGLPILPLLVRYDEVKTGLIDHALRFTLGNNIIMRAYTAPATHLAGNPGTANLNGTIPTPNGMRLRLKASYVIPATYSPTTKVILQALKDYGMILADGGGNGFISGAPDDRWDDNANAEIKSIHLTDFEVMKMDTIFYSPGGTRAIVPGVGFVTYQ